MNLKDMSDGDVLNRLRTADGAQDVDDGRPLAQRQREGIHRLKGLLDRSTKAQMRAGFQKRNREAKEEAARKAAKAE